MSPHTDGRANMATVGFVSLLKLKYNCTVWNSLSGLVLGPMGQNKTTANSNNEICLHKHIDTTLPARHIYP